MELEKFEKVVTRAVESLSPELQKKIKNVAFLVEKDVSVEERKVQGMSTNETLLGLYKGIPLTERGESYGVGPTMPDTITIFMEPIMYEAEVTGESVEKIIYDTVLHEIAHFFGMDEGEVEEREKKGWRKRS